MQQRNLKMSEEDTYNALRKWTFEATEEYILTQHEERYVSLEEYNEVKREFYRITGWTMEEFALAYREKYYEDHTKRNINVSLFMHRCFTHAKNSNTDC